MRRVRDAEGVEWGGKWAGGIPLPSGLGGMGERRKLPQRGPGRTPGGVRGGPPAENGFLCILSLKKRIW